MTWKKPERFPKTNENSRPGGRLNYLGPTARNASHLRAASFADPDPGQYRLTGDKEGEMTPARRRALEWCREGGHAETDAPSVAMIQRLEREGLVSYWSRMTDYRDDPAGRVIPAGWRLTEEGKAALDGPQA